MDKDTLFSVLTTVQIVVLLVGALIAVFNVREAMIDVGIAKKIGNGTLGFTKYTLVSRQITVLFWMFLLCAVLLNSSTLSTFLFLAGYCTMLTKDAYVLIARSRLRGELLSKHLPEQE